MFEDLTSELRKGRIAPCCSAPRSRQRHLRLLKALRHESPIVDETASRFKVENAKSAA